MNIGGAGSYIYEKPQIEGQSAPGPIEHPARVEERKVNAAPPKGPSKGEKGGAGHPAGGWVRCPTLTSLCLTASSVTTFTGEPNMCPRCGKRVYFGKAVVGAGHVLRAGTWWQEPWGTHQLRGGGRGPWGFIRRGDVPACW